MAGVWKMVGSLGKSERQQTPAEVRSVVAGFIGAFVACLFAMEMLLGSGAWSHMVRLVLLGGLMLSTVALACLLPSDRQQLPQT